MLKAMPRKALVWQHRAGCKRSMCCLHSWPTSSEQDFAELAPSTSAISAF